MAGPYSGKSCTIYIPKIETGYSSTTFTGEAMSQVGSSLVYYIADRTKMVWDPDNTITVYDGGAEITTGYVIDYACGRVTLAVAPSGAVTATGKYFTSEIMVGGFGWNARKSGSKHDVTTYEHVGDTLAYRSYVGGLIESTGSIRRHWYYVPASWTDPIGTANAKLTWTWNGKDGNDEAIVYSAGGSLEVARASNITTVTYETGVTTAAAIKAHVEADATLNALFTLTYPVADWTAGYHTGGLNPSVDISGGTDTSFNIIADGETYPRLITLTVAGLNSGALIAAAIQTAIRALGGTYASITCTYEHSPPNDHYLITSATTGSASSITITDAASNNVADDLKIATANGGTSTAGTAGSGAGVVGAVSHTHLSGGRDSSQLMSKVGQKVPLILYLNSASATGERLCGVANLDNFGIEDPVDGVVDSPLDFTVDGGLVYVDY